MNKYIEIDAQYFFWYKLQYNIHTESTNVIHLKE